MKTFLDTKGKSFTFSSCDSCPARCCDGREGSILSEILIEDFEKIAQYFPILFTFGELGYLKANVLLSNGEDFCPYILNHQCTIYENRPSICKNYPLSPTIENKIYIDKSCPAVDQMYAQEIIKNGKVSKYFNNNSLYDYQNKYVKTHQELEKINNRDDFQKVLEINGLPFYKYVGALESSYIDFHYDSLNNKREYYNFVDLA